MLSEGCLWFKEIVLGLGVSIGIVWGWWRIWGIWFWGEGWYWDRGLVGCGYWKVIYSIWGLLGGMILKGEGVDGCWGFE